MGMIDMDLQGTIRQKGIYKKAMKRVRREKGLMIMWRQVQLRHQEWAESCRQARSGWLLGHPCRCGTRASRVVCTGSQLTWDSAGRSQRSHSLRSRRKVEKGILGGGDWLHGRHDEEGALGFDG